MKFLIKREEELTPIKLGTIISQFRTKDLPRYNRYWNYYSGKHSILRKQPTDTGKPCNRVVVNYCYNITENYLGYIAGIPISYSGENIEPIIDIFKYNDYHNEDNELLRKALIFGRSFELCYIDELGKQRFCNLDTRQCIPVYDDTIEENLMYVVRFYQDDMIGNYQTDPKYIVEVYGPDHIATYRSNSGFSSFELLEIQPHSYNQCPITVFALNEDETSIYDQIMTLQDAYNDILSGEVDDFDSFADAYLIMKGVSADEEDLANAKRARAFCVDSDADISYLTKSFNDGQTENILKNIDAQIHKISNSPDFTQESFGVASGIALRFRLLGFENTASSIESHMRKALQKRIELLSTINKVVEGNEAVWRDVDIVFTRNLPTDLNDLGTIVNQFRGLVSDETLMALLPFVKDVEEEKKKIQEQKESNMALYSSQFESLSDEDKE